jgi:hypothetical protein
MTSEAWGGGRAGARFRQGVAVVLDAAAVKVVAVRPVRSDSVRVMGTAGELHAVDIIDEPARAASSSR